MPEPASEFLLKCGGIFSDEQLSRIKKALEFAKEAHQGQRRGTGEPYVEHPIAVASILLDWHPDTDTIIAALLHDVPEDTAVSLDDVRDSFGADVARLVEGVTKLSSVRVPKGKADYQAENLRHLFLASAKDVRVVLLKLADRLHNMRTMKGVPPHKRQRIGRETIEVYAPLADRLGMGEVRGELDDLGFRYASPEEYRWTVAQLEQSSRKREQYLVTVKRELTELLETNGLKAAINARTKNVHSLYKKLLQKERDIDKIYDLFAIRVIVDSIADCYRGMGIIHSHYQPLPHRMKDYIAVPKQNGYRSLHTTIFGPDKRLLEVQFRTKGMHEEAELGVAAHAVYAETKSSKNASNDEISLLRQLADWQEELTEGIPLEQLKLDVFADRLFVFSPKGALHRLPKDATAVDFAYSVHTEVGNTCRGAKVNGVLVGLDYPLQNGDVVEILTQARKQPSLDWLRFVKTGHARNAIRSFYRQRDREAHIETGKSLLHDTAKRRSQELGEESLKQAAKKLPGIKSLDDLYATVGSGLLTADSVFAEEHHAKPRKPITTPQSRPAEVSLTGIHSLATRRAKCCDPRPPAKIVGYVTVGAGITIHRTTCSQIQHPPDPSRLLPVDWEEAAR